MNRTTSIADRIETVRIAAEGGALAAHAATKSAVEGAMKTESAWGPAMRR